MPRLIVMRGAHHQFHDMVGERTTLGAHDDNDVVVDGDAGVSRWHCTITRRDGSYRLKDRGSRTGTFLNGSRVEKADLSYGDRMRLGHTVVIFTSTGRKQKDERTARRLSNLLILQEITKELNTESDRGQLLELIMDTAIQLVGAERGFLVLVKGSQLEFKVARNIDAEEVKSPEFKISNTVIRNVVKSAEPILTSNAQFDLKDFKSIAALELRSLLCVPLRVKSKTIGTLYLDSMAHGSQFDEEARDLLMAFSDQAAIALENARLLREAKEKESILSELRVASRIQVALLPRKDPEIEGMEISGRMMTAQEVGGDYFDYIWGPTVNGERNLNVAIGDVSGKGVPAGLVMVMARSILRSLVARGGARPRDVLHECNRLLKQDLKPGMFMSMLLATVHGPTGRLLIAGCGHERPLLYRAKSRTVERIEVGGLVLGVVPDNDQYLEELEVALEPGDQVLLYTDGVTEHVDDTKNQFGMDRLERLLQQGGGESPSRLVKKVLSSLEVHARGAIQHDDITLIAIRRPAAAALQ